VIRQTELFSEKLVRVVCAWLPWLGVRENKLKLPAVVVKPIRAFRRQHAHVRPIIGCDVVALLFRDNGSRRLTEVNP
jgi:hypothetical protein